MVAERRKVAKRKQRNYFEASLGAQIVASWIIGRIAQKCYLNGTKKR
jgi:hypothetical protein